MARLRTRIILRLLFSAFSAVWSAGPGAGAQTPANLELDLRLHPGLVIQGSPGSVYTVEYASDLTRTDPGDWRCLAFLQLQAASITWFDPAPASPGQRFYRASRFTPPTNLVFIPPGSFRLGSPTNEVDRIGGPAGTAEGPQVATTIDRGFWMGRYEVTQAEYAAVVGKNPSAFPGDPSRPVEQVSWNDAVNYCALLTAREKAAGRIAANCRYRLPTEAEWEYACRGWTSTRFSHGDDPGYTNLVDHAWYIGNSSAKTHPVGQKLPNVWGLYDMHGNVWEWCLDWYAPYPTGIAVDPQGPATGTERVVRGGSWNANTWICRSAMRGTPNGRMPSVIGFRVVLAADR